MAKAGRDSRTVNPAAAAGVDVALPAWLRIVAGGFELAIHAQPGARRRAIVGPHGARLKLAVTAPPTEGRANESVLALLAERLRIAPSAVALAGGASRRDKRVVVGAGLSAAQVIERLRPD